MRMYLLPFAILLLLLLALNACTGIKKGVVGGAVGPVGMGAPVTSLVGKLPNGKMAACVDDTLKSAKHLIFSVEAYCNLHAGSIVLGDLSFKVGQAHAFSVSVNMTALERATCPSPTVSVSICNDPKSLGSCLLEPASQQVYQVRLGAGAFHTLLVDNSAILVTLPQEVEPLQGTRFSIVS
jgi:hypothetical protein